MAFTPIANTVLVAIQGTQHGQARVNTLAYRYNNPAPTSGELTNLGAAIATAILPPMEAAATTDCAWQNIHLRDVGSTSGLAVDYPLVGPFVGTRNVTDSPGNVTLCISKRSGVSGRAFRGRWYTVGPASGDFPADIATASYLTLAANIGAQLLIARLSGRFTPAIATSVFHTSTPILSIVIDTVSDSMRRRLAGRGR